MAKEKTLSNVTVYIFMGLMVVTGSINTIANKLQNLSSGLGKPYSHTWFITFCMFFGEIFCIIAYMIQTRNQVNDTPLVDDENNNKGTEEELPEATPFNLILPALCDFFGSTIMTFGLTLMAGSVYQMFRGSLILFTALFSVVFLKNKLYRHHFFALIFVISGLLMVGLASILIHPEIPEKCKDPSGDSSGEQTSFWGIVLVIIAQLFSATQFIVEEKFMKSYKCAPLKAVGWEGIWGASLYLIVLIIFQFIPCDATLPISQFTKTVCSQDDQDNWKLENTVFAFRQMGDNGLLLFFVILYVCSIAVFNFVGISVTKYASSPARAVIDTVRTIFVWLFFLLPIVDECHRESFNWLQLGGFVMLVFGTVIYNEVVILPFLGLNKFTKEALKNEKAEEKESLDTIKKEKYSRE
jgi:drug/metabolite transporter (DMT)-like permease